MAIDEPIIGNECWLYTSADRTTITEGDSVQFTVSQVGACSSSQIVDIYINDSVVYTGQLSNNSFSYVHIFTEPGEFTVYADSEGFNSPGNFINITVEEDIVELPTSQVSWKINNKNVQSIEINNKEVKSIITSNGQVLYNKEENADNILKLQFTGSSFSTYSDTPFTYMGNVFVDWGDDTGLIEYTGGKLSHSYSANETYTIKIYGDITSLNTNAFNNRSGLTSVIIPDSVTSLGDGCFGRCYSLTSVIIPDSVTSLGDGCFTTCARLISIIIPDSVTSLGEHCFESCSDLTSVIIPDSVTNLESYCFYGCSNLTNINLNWNTSNKILTYDNTWIMGANSNLKFNIPNGTTSLYISKNYPSNKLMEIGNISLSSDKNILSYYDNDTATLSATVTSSNNELMSGVTVEFFNGNTSLGTAITNSSGIATKTYASSGNGNVVFSAIGSNLTSQPITVEDCTYYNATQYSSPDVTLDIPLPSHFSLEFVIKQTSSSLSVPYLDIGDDTNNRIVIGQYAREGGNGLIIYKGSATTYTYSTNPTFNQENTVHFIYDGTNYTYWLNDLAPMTILDNGITLSKLIHSSTGRGGYLKDIKIKPLNSISLVASQSILSHADGDSTTLTATHSLGTGKTVKLYDANDNTLIGAMTDNLDGTYSYTYNSQGIGDLTVYASDGDIVSEDILIEDCYYANIGDTDKSSDFDIANAWTSKNVALGTVTVTNNTEWYTITRTGGGSNYAFIPISKLTGINKAFTLSCVIETKQGTPDEGTYCGMYGENYNATWSTAYPCRIVHTTTGSSDNWNKVYDYSVSYGVYKMELTFDGTSYNYKLYDSNGTLQRDLSVTMNSRQNNTSNTVRYGVVMSNVSTSGFVVLRIKDIKAKICQDELPGVELAP